MSTNPNEPTNPLTPAPREVEAVAELALEMIRASQAAGAPASICRAALLLAGRIMDSKLEAAIASPGIPRDLLEVAQQSRARWEAWRPLFDKMEIIAFMKADGPPPEVAAEVEAGALVVPRKVPDAPDLPPPPMATKEEIVMLHAASHKAMSLLTDGTCCRFHTFMAAYLVARVARESLLKETGDAEIAALHALIMAQCDQLDAIPITFDENSEPGKIRIVHPGLA